MSEENPRIGSTLESLLREDGIYEDAKNHAIKAVLAYKLTRAMKAQRLSKVRMAERMETSRSQLDRLLDPENERVTLHMSTLVGRAPVLPMTFRSPAASITRAVTCSREVMASAVTSCRAAISSSSS